MPAVCYWCKVSDTNSIATPIGKRDEPFACCQECQVFTCGHHGVRDNGIKSFICFDCDARGLCVMAVQNTAADRTEEQVSGIDPAIRLFRLLFNDEMQFVIIIKPKNYLTFDQFVQSREGYRAWVDRFEFLFRSAINLQRIFPDMTDDEIQLLYQLPPDARNYLILAGTILSMMYKKGIPSTYPPLLQHLTITMKA